MPKISQESNSLRRSIFLTNLTNIEFNYKQKKVIEIVLEPKKAFTLN